MQSALVVSRFIPVEVCCRLHCDSVPRVPFGRRWVGSAINDTAPIHQSMLCVLCESLFHSVFFVADVAEVMLAAALPSLHGLTRR